MTPANDPDDADLAARALYVDWVKDWTDLRSFITDRLNDDLTNLTPRRLFVAAWGSVLKLPQFEKPALLRPLFAQWTDRSAWSLIHHRHHLTDRLPIRGHVYIPGAPTTSWDDGHFHVRGAENSWTDYETIDFSNWI